MTKQDAITALEALDASAAAIERAKACVELTHHAPGRVLSAQDGGAVLEWEEMGISTQVIFDNDGETRFVVWHKGQRRCLASPRIPALSEVPT